MKFISFNSHQVSISKYFLYGLIMCLLLGFTVGDKIWYAITFKRTTGIISYFTFTEGHGRRGRTHYYPVVDYEVKGKLYSCLGSRFQREGSFVGDQVPVIYDPSNPWKGYVYNFSGYWAPQAVYLIPLIAFLTLAVNIDSTPSVIKITFRKSV